jgi:hypothetical protein
MLPTHALANGVHLLAVGYCAKAQAWLRLQNDSNQQTGQAKFAWHRYEAEQSLPGSCAIFPAALQLHTSTQAD